jgi:hypothetical protein
LVISFATEIANLYKSADKNKDGNITIKELVAAWGSHYDRADVNGDGTLSIDELTAAALFYYFDKNKDGVLTYDEYEVLKGKLVNPPGASEIDKNNNNTIDVGEFVTHFSK